MSNKIEAGCRAVIVNSVAGNNGIVVTVLEKVGIVKVRTNGSGQFWTVDTPLSVFVTYAIGPVRKETTTSVTESHLQRLPDEPANTKCEWDETIFKPEDLKINTKEVAL